MAVSARSIACWAPSKMGREAWVQIYNYLALKLDECHDRAVGWAGRARMRLKVCNNSLLEIEYMMYM